MPRTKTRKRTPAKKRSALPPLDLQRTGMPARDSIISVKEPKKGKKLYRFIVTNEVDEYEQPAEKSKRKKS
jgi:hypothetical protein